MVCDSYSCHYGGVDEAPASRTSPQAGTQRRRGARPGAAHLRVKGLSVISPVITLIYFAEQITLYFTRNAAEMFSVNTIPFERQQKYVICENFNYLTITVHEIRPGDRRTDRRTAES
ncbi:hypothetical protein EVAR_11797_1 [Eumeta japonica]|uniref:Uncharacterized protein n=1 Tax=Eumeta variegata TaxID=151549 RepID=A0A4C1UPI2_EUMVA|nr:hypothetical protein EVAR_11797_1 [Eumeta japonica]